MNVGWRSGGKSDGSDVLYIRNDIPKNVSMSAGFGIFGMTGWVLLRICLSHVLYGVFTCSLLFPLFESDCVLSKLLGSFSTTIWHNKGGCVALFHLISACRVGTISCFSEIFKQPSITTTCSIQEAK